MTVPLRVLIVDDEPLALERLAGLVEQVRSAEVVGTFLSGREAADAMRGLRPDLLLIDVEMPRVSGFDLIEMVRERQLTEKFEPPLICFVTAYPQFAPEAFDTGAIDYLCKPVRLVRLQKTIARARTFLEQRDAAARLDLLSNELAELREKHAANEARHLWLKHRGEMIRLEVAAIDWLKAEGECVRLHFGDRSHLHRTSLSSMCADLEADGFVRIHRSAVVNPARVKVVRRKRSGLSLLLDSGVELPVGRRYRQVVEGIVPLAAV